MALAAPDVAPEIGLIQLGAMLRLHSASRGCVVGVLWPRDDSGGAAIVLGGPWSWVSEDMFCMALARLPLARV
jgi:hypothetical protein